MNNLCSNLCKKQTCWIITKSDLMAPVLGNNVKVLLGTYPRCVLVCVCLEIIEYWVCHEVQINLCVPKVCPRLVQYRNTAIKFGGEEGGFDNYLKRVPRRRSVAAPTFFHPQLKRKKNKSKVQECFIYGCCYAKFTSELVKLLRPNFLLTMWFSTSQHLASPLENMLSAVTSLVSV